MSWFTRAKSFVEKTPAAAADVEAEFDNIADSFNGLFKTGRVSASENLTLTTSYQDVPGASLSITPSVASRLLVWATADVQVGTPTQLSLGYAFVKLNVDGADRTEQMLRGYFGGAAVERQPLHQDYSITLTAAAHTIKLRSKMENAESATCYGTHTGFTYLLIPEP
jgi:hypothetical protein